MAWTHKSILTGIAKHLETNLTDAADYRHIGIVPTINDESDYKNFVGSKVPFIGTALMNLPMNRDGGLQYLSPHMLIQVSMCLKQTGARIETEMTDFYDKLQDLQSVLLAAERANTHFSDGIDAVDNPTFDPATQILAVETMGLTNLPSFISKIDQNRKAFSICYFSVKLHMSDI